MTSRAHHAMRRSSRAGWLGLAAVLVVAAVGWVAFRALTGLPWQSHYHVTVALPDADRLLTASDVRVGGVRVGSVARVHAVEGPDGRPIAEVALQLDPDVGPLPVDTTVAVRSASPLGATYVALTPGRASAAIRDGGRLPLTRARTTGDLVDLFRVFDRAGRRDFRTLSTELSDGLAGRGGSLNQLVESTGALLPRLDRVAATLAAPDTRLGPFIRSYAGLAARLGPLDRAIAAIAGNGAQTFDAVARRRGALDEALRLAPSTERAATTALHAAGPALDGLAGLTTRLRTTARHLPAELQAINTTLGTATPALRDAPRVAAPLRTTLGAVAQTARLPSTDGAVRKLTELFDSGNDVLEALVPAQTTCNVVGAFMSVISSVSGVLGVGQGPSMLGLMVGARGPITTGTTQTAKAAPDLTVNYAPHENAHECEAGNEPPVSGQLFTNPAGLQSTAHRVTHPPPHVLELARGAGLLAP